MSVHACAEFGSQQGSEGKGPGIHLDVGPRYLCFLVAGGACPLATYGTTPVRRDAPCRYSLLVWVGERASDSGRQL